MKTLFINLDLEMRSYLYVYINIIYTHNTAWNFDVMEVKLGM